MSIANFLAEFWGFSMVIVSMAFLAYPRYSGQVIKAIEEEKNVIICGILNVMAGIALILLYNVWDKSWKVIITIIGWLVLVRGIICLFSPHIIKKILEKVKAHSDRLPALFAGGVILGCVLIYLGATS